MTKDVVKEHEKIIFWGTLGVLAIGVFVFAHLSAERRNTLAERIAGMERREDAVPVNEENSRGEQSSQLKPAQAVSGEEPAVLNNRDIFSRGRPPQQQYAAVSMSVAPADGQTARFEVVEINRKPLGIAYEGRIVFLDGRIAAQVNVGEKSYIVGIGSTLLTYTVIDLSKDKLVLVNGAARYVVNYRQTAYTDERMATIKELNSNTIIFLSKNSSFLGGTVLDIDEDAVLVSSQGQDLRLEKGTVYP